MQFQQLGPYRLGKKLGQGGMGAVYAGVEVESGQAAAIKILSPSLAAEEGFRVRFEAEIESLKKLRHPNIVRLYGYGEQSGTLFYAMELVEGTSLEDELRGRRRFDWREVTHISIKLCRALKHAHDHGIIHRDLKPANLLITSDNDVKLSDFGIARLFGNSRLTSEGGVLGTAEYMAPEQASGATVTDRCDQYSLGGVMYALLAGRPPFRAKTLVEMLQLQRFAEPEPVTTFAPQTPEELERIIHQLLEKDPQRRFANTLILARSLEAMERGLSISRSQHDDFSISLPSSDKPTATREPLAETLSPTQLAENEQRRAGSSGDPAATEATMAFTPQPKEAKPTGAAPISDTSIERFTKVEARREVPSEGPRESLRGLLAPQTLTLAVALLMLLAAGWYFMQPPNADKLYRRIESAAAEREAGGMPDMAPMVDSFLNRFPDDPRAETVGELRDEAQQGSPVQRALTEAKRYKLINPQLAAAKLRALIDVYEDPRGESAGGPIKMARLELKALEKQLARSTADDRRGVESRLARAAELADDGDSSAARRIYRGVVELYGDKAWASELVGQAKSRLAEMSDGRAAAQ